MTNESAVLGLLADLYKQVSALRAENDRLRLHLAEAQREEPVEA
jgi:hypothetical protein